MEHSEFMHPLLPTLRLRRRPPMEPRAALHQRGVTLMELLIAMVITAILASIAIPSYTSYVRESRRADAKTALLDVASLEERYFSVNNTYSTAVADLGYTGAWPVTVGAGYYQIQQPVVVAAVAPTAALPAGTPASYTLTAVPIGTQTKDTPCMNFVLTSAGAKTNSGPLTTCWN